MRISNNAPRHKRQIAQIQITYEELFELILKKSAELAPLDTSGGYITHADVDNGRGILRVYIHDNANPPIPPGQEPYYYGYGLKTRVASATREEDV